MTAVTRYHGTVTAIRQTKSNHTIVQMDGKEEFVLTGQDVRIKNTLRPLDNILYAISPAPTVLPFKKEKVTFTKRGMFILSVQASDASLERVSRARRPVRGTITGRVVTPASNMEEVDGPVSDELIDTFRAMLTLRLRS